MGFSLESVPVRLDSAPMRALRAADAEAVDEASLHPPFCERHYFGDPTPAANRELLALLPEGFDRPWRFPGRTHQQAEYLIDPVGHGRIRSREERERSLPYRIIHGDEPFAEHARGTQGVAWRCSTSKFLADAAARIDAIDVEAARRDFSIADMVERAVYKVGPTEDDEETFTWVLAHLRALARWYHRVADAGVDLIVILD